MNLSHHKKFFGLSSFEMLAMFRRGLFYAYLSIYLRHYLGLSVTETTLFATLPMIVNIVCQTFIWGKVSDRFQLRRTLIVIGEVLAGIGTLLVWYVHRKFAQPAAAGYAIIVGLSVVEIFWSMSNIAWSALISDIYTDQYRSRVLGRLTSMGGLGRMAGVWVGGLLYDGMGSHFSGWGFYEGGLFFVASGAMWVSTLPLLLLPEGGANPSKKAAVAVSGTKTLAATTLFFTLFLIGMCFINFGRNSVAIIIAQYLTLPKGLGVGSRELGYIFNTQSVAMILLGWTTGWMSRRIGDDVSLMASTLVGIVALLVLAKTTWLPMVYVCSFLRGFADVIIMATSYTMASVLIPPEKRARLFALFNATFFLSWGLAGTFIAGPIVDLLIQHDFAETTAYQVSFVVAAGITCIGLVLQGILKWMRSSGRVLSY
ncbi:MAG: MFS transporter [Deltaproteobacteria bacterium]|nr:MFS transporter [Deltaproteobacteria bacterium]